MKTLITDPRIAPKLMPGHWLKWGWMPFLASILMVGCVSQMKPPLVELQAAERAISNAERAQTMLYSSAELDAARAEMAAARTAVISKNMHQAQRLALQAQATAELALMRAELIKAQAINQDMQQSVDALREEAKHTSRGVQL